VSRKIAETEIARAVVTELQRLGFDTYEEVSTGYASKRGDVVGLRGPVVIVVECKASMSLKLLEQVLLWKGGATMIVAASGFSRTSMPAERLLRAEGIGFWTVSPNGGTDGRDDIRELVGPKFFRTASTQRLRTLCTPETKTGSMYAAAGSTGGGYYTPFRATVRALEQIVKKEPGITLREAVKRIECGHYASAASARNSLSGLIHRGVIAGIRMEIAEDGRTIQLFPVVGFGPDALRVPRRS